MKAIVAEWIARTEGDWNVAQREWRARRRPNYDAVCFHAQQCAEKYLKGRLSAGGADPPRIHDQLALLDAVAALEPELSPLREEMALLTVYAVRNRYPGDAATRDEAGRCIAALRRFRRQIRAVFRMDRGKRKRRPR